MKSAIKSTTFPAGARNGADTTSRNIVDTLPGSFSLIRQESSSDHFCYQSGNTFQRISKHLAWDCGCRNSWQDEHTKECFGCDTEIPSCQEFCAQCLKEAQEEI